MLKISDYDFNLPEELIAQIPTEKRGDSRLMVVDRKSGKISHKKFRDIAGYFSKGDCLVINTTKVIPVRIFGKKKTGGKVEVLLTEIKSPYEATALLKPSVNEGEEIFFEKNISARIGSKIFTDGGEPTGERGLIFNLENAHRFLVGKSGVMPLPPYIKRKGESLNLFAEMDKNRYQTIYAKDDGSIAAPTAGLHFTQEIMTEIKNSGAEIAEITLHVGLGTFRKVVSDDISRHRMLPEKFLIPQSAADKINSAIISGHKIFATGTTCTRALETAASDVPDDTETNRCLIKAMSGESSLYIYPGYKFKIVDCLITNFHLPRSTPLFLAAAFCGKDHGRELLFKAYDEAIKSGYRFFSYGDAMLIL